MNEIPLYCLIKTDKRKEGSVDNKFKPGDIAVHIRFGEVVLGTGAMRPDPVVGDFQREVQTVSVHGYEFLPDGRFHRQDKNPILFTMEEAIKFGFWV